MRSAEGRRFVVVGGYGHVGRRLAERLARQHDVVIAGRRLDAANTVADELGCSSAAVDATNGGGLERVVRPGDVVVNASSDQPDAVLLRATVALNGDYADLSADASSIASMLDRHDEVVARGRRALVGVGLSPGATNVMARAALDDRPTSSRVDTVVVLSVADDFGPAAVEWTLRAVDPPAPLVSGERTVAVHPFAARRRLHLPGVGAVLAHEFPFPEQYFIPDTLGVDESTSWCAFHPPAAGRVVAGLIRQPWIRRLVTRPSITRRLVGFSGLIPGAGRPGLVGAAAIAFDDDGTTMVSLASRSESQTTAECAAALLDLWPDRADAHGVHLPENVVPTGTFLRRLAAADMHVETTRV